MKLYYSKGACSLASHIVLAELNMVYETESVDLRSKVMATGGDFRTINPKGSVPTMRLDNGEVLTEGAVIMQYLADQKPEAGLLPKYGTFERYRTLEWLNYVSTELHKSFTPLFMAGMYVKEESAQKDLTENVKRMINFKLAHVNEKMTGKEFLMGKQMTIADAYLFTVLGWAKFKDIDLSVHPNIAAFMERMAQRPSVQRAMKEEGWA